MSCSLQGDISKHSGFALSTLCSGWQCHALKDKLLSLSGLDRRRLCVNCVCVHVRMCVYLSTCLGVKCGSAESIFERILLTLTIVHRCYTVYLVYYLIDQFRY